MSVETLENKHEKTYTRRVSQVGNSLSVSVPKDLAELLKMNKGDEIVVSYDEEKNGLVMKPVNHVPEGVRPEVLQAMNRAITKYDDALRNLKDR
ncbi:AbrB/MazE/SpoVT family DNA-binding domain-containing protein [Halobacillus hunanensis]|uniref:AbrB/MazE/SpoVT family DNA-binding domain-containing protein n=1 Tax=Halobacillus hunanensis TaxID=578214 RepID=UPI0009A7979F|nr:AbrB/MazE/SpoVT family DNA-binding domain-containing protein [Halobacillus hunanensis]